MSFLPRVAPLLLLAALGCSPYSVKVDYDRTVDMARYRTFDWYAPTPQARAKARGQADPLVDKRVRTAVERELAAKGYQQERTAEPDFLVTYYPTYRVRATRHTTGMGIGFGRPYGYRVGTRFMTTDIHTFAEGSIVLEIVDRRSDELVWQAVAKGALTGLEDPETADTRVAAAVKDLLAAFPPGTSARTR